MRTAFLLALLLLAGTLSGCSGARTGRSVTAEALQLGDPVETGPDDGSIQGVVVDEAIRPIAAANITVGAASAKADAQGRFAFLHLKPGVVFLKVEAPGFLPAQTSAAVEVGKVAEVRVALAADRTPQPYHLTQHFRGHIDFHAGSATLVFQNYAPGTLQCGCEFTVASDPGLRTIVVDATGTVQVPSPDPVQQQGYHSVYWEIHGRPTGGAEQDLLYRYADFPFSDQYKVPEQYNGTDHWMVRITGGAWVSGTMDFDLYLTLFYRAEAPKEWAFLKGDQ
ncbi:MAG TPA: carboxypeptidase-like regulatory domain-containing protein [Candidatus Thermoplasmatota archaeon]|nr:carboxypeptidase-like regulatory domain-containing protein [Candidatus Thermoplasmatota archaeon]